MKYKKKIAISAVFIGAALLLTACGGVGASGEDTTEPLWRIERVVSSEAEFGNNGLEFDSSGDEHLIYKRDSDDQLVYLRRDGSGWSSEDTGRTTIDNDFFLSDDDKPNLVTMEFTSGLTNVEIYHVSNSDGTNWIEGHILTDGSIFTLAGAIDSNDTVHVAYNYADYDLGYASGTGAVWSTNDLDTSISDIDIGTAITVDSSDTVHLVYLDYGASPYTLKLISAPTTGSETVHTIDPSGGADEVYALEIDDGGRIHVAYGWYQQGEDQELRYALYNGVSWTTETVSAGMDLGYPPSIAVDSSGTVHIAYIGDSDQDLFYARKEGGWNVERVPAEGDQLASPELELDDQELPVIIYNDRSSGVLELASRSR